MFVKSLMLSFFFCSIVFSQHFSLNGKITDKTTNEVLSYGNVRIANSTFGTAANFEGNYELKLKSGRYTVITSFIGYKSDTIFVNLTSDQTINISLEPVPVRLQEITVLPKENPALEIIRRTISAKHERNKKLNSYIFNAYTKGLVKTTKDIITSDRSVGLSIGVKDTGALKITGIIENESKGFFKKPDYYKDEITARKQSANTPPSINILTGGRLLQNFYTNDIQFFNRPLLGPIADDALDFYYYIIEDTLAIDNRNVFQVYFEPIDKSDPGFYGKIFIADSIFSLVKLDVNLNDAANPGGIFSKINILQQFVPYVDKIYMPIDYRVFVEGNFLGLAKFGFELNSIFYDYEINSLIDDNFFGMAIIKILPDADKKDSTFWKSTQTIPNTLEEIQAYARIDSLEAIPRNFWNDFSLLASSLYFSDNFSISGPLSLYSFNRIEGHSINFGAVLSNEFNKRLNSSLNFGYGFSDKKFKTDFSMRYYLGEYRTHSISLNTFNKLDDLFGESIRYNNFTSTLTSLLGKYDFRDYFYTKGWELRFSSEVFPVLRLGVGFFNRTDNSAINKSDFSIFNRSKTYRQNQLIYETKINAATIDFTLDFRKYIEDGYFRRRTSFGEAIATFSGEAIFSNKSAFKSTLDFEMYQLYIYTYIPTFKSASMSFGLKGVLSEGTIPYQMMYALPGNIESSGKSFTFRTIGTGEVFGDKVVTLTMQHSFNDELFRLLNIPFIKDLQLILTAHFNAALVQISDKSKLIIPRQYTEFKHPFYEIGFGIGQMLFPFTIEFTWKLNYKGKNNFVIGINTFAL